MKSKVIVFAFLSLFLLSCQQRPIILSTQQSFTKIDGSGFSGTTNYIYFQSVAIGSQTQVTFSNDDGDYAKFTFLSISPANIDLDALVDLKMHFIGAGEGSDITATAGFFNITGSQGSGGNVTSFTGSFQFNVTTANPGEANVGPPADVGTVKGVFNYVKTQ